MQLHPLTWLVGHGPTGTAIRERRARNRGNAAAAQQRATPSGEVDQGQHLAAAQTGGDGSQPYMTTRPQASHRSHRIKAARKSTRQEGQAAHGRAAKSSNFHTSKRIDASHVGG